jgi:hypothetical protein
MSAPLTKQKQNTTAVVTENGHMNTELTGSAAISGTLNAGTVATDRRGTYCAVRDVHRRDSTGIPCFIISVVIRK